MAWAWESTTAMWAAIQATLPARSVRAEQCLADAAQFSDESYIAEDYGDRALAATCAIDCVRCISEALDYDMRARWRRILDW